MAADKLLDRGWGGPSQDMKLQAEPAPGVAENVKTVVEHEALQAIEHEGAAIRDR
ncbi:MAG: hypothetical protein WA813_03635 [Beijerinckiaceae bacterium]